MKVSREQFAEHRTRILDAASRLFREHGFDGVGLDQVMKAAGLTHGAFYGHFKSKAELVACSLQHALAQADESWRTAEAPTARLAELYLADDHCNDVSGGCALAALSTDVARQDARTQQTLRTALAGRIDALADTLDGDPATRRQRAIATWSSLVGALMLARAVDDEGLAQEILEAGRATHGAKRKGRRR